MSDPNLSAPPAPRRSSWDPRNGGLPRWALVAAVTAFLELRAEVKQLGDANTVILQRLGAIESHLTRPANRGILHGPGVGGHQAMPRRDFTPAAPAPLSVDSPPWSVDQ